jgi:hypothetical protein
MRWTFSSGILYARRVPITSPGGVSTLALILMLVCLVLVTPLHSAPVTPAQSPGTTALACTVSGEASNATVDVIGGHVAGKGWLESEEAKGLMKPGDRLTLCALEAGVLGSVTLSDDGSVQSEQPIDAGPIWGLSYKARISIPSDKQDAYAKAKSLRHGVCAMDLVSVWSKTSSRPSWVAGQLLPGALSEDSEYRDLLTSWLRSRLRGAPDVTNVELDDAVRADINGDGRDEVFLSFRCTAHWSYTEDDVDESAEGHITPGPHSLGLDYGYWQTQEDDHSSERICYRQEDPHSSRKFFSFLVMRHLPRGQSKVETIVLDKCPCRGFWVIGFCDLDGDGTAEVITRGGGQDYTGAKLFHWDGKRFHVVDGWGAGA